MNVLTKGVSACSHVQQVRARECVKYEAAAEMSVCAGRSDHRGHVKVEPHRSKLFTSREKRNKHLSAHSAGKMRAQSSFLEMTFMYYLCRSNDLLNQHDTEMFILIHVLEKL